jgi:signal transduction histidine kinase/ligand-binding sensor domain-containing protein/DNA-binding response OmpR family regulator
MFFACIAGIGFAANPDYKHLTTRDGLSNSVVRKIFQDSRGFVWLGTEDGLNFFDGYSFRVYKNNAIDTTTISNNNISSIAEDARGNIWIGTHNGLNVLNPETNKFKRYFHHDEKPESISDNLVTHICVDSSDEIWVGTMNGLNRYDPATDGFQHYSVNHDVNISMRGNSITALVSDHKGYIWTSEFNKGLFRLDPETNDVVHFPIDNVNGVIGDIVTTISNNPNGNLWLGLINGQIIDFNPRSGQAKYYISDLPYPDNTNSIVAFAHLHESLWILQGKYILRFDLSNHTFDSYTHNPQDRQSIPMGTPFSITQTHNDNILVGLEGLLIFDPDSRNFTDFYKVIPKESDKIKQNYVRAFYKDERGDLIIGTYRDGLLMKDHNTGNYIRIQTPDVFQNSIITHFEKRDDGKLWVATSKGLLLYDTQNKSIIDHYQHIPGDSKSIDHDHVNLVLQDSRNILWVATQESLDRIDLSSGDIKHYNRSNLNGLSHYKITAIIEDRRGNIWVGTFNGLNKIGSETGAITSYIPHPGGRGGISDPFINAKGLYEDREGFIWICTKNGLNRYDPENDIFTSFFQEDGLMSDNVSAIREDSEGFHWVVSNKGLSRVDFDADDFKHYTADDRLDNNTEAFMIDEQGFLHVGGRHENYYRFHPDSLSRNLVPPRVYISDLLILNKPVGVYPADPQSPLKKNILFANDIVLNYKQSDFSIEFTALNFFAAEKNLFAYKLEGYHDDWIYTDASRRMASFANLPAGDYVFKVKASNNDGIWNEELASINLKILPPPWKTNAALVAYFLLIVMIMLLIRTIMVRELRLKNSLKLEHFQREKEREFDEMKTKFFINISHEFKTPLMLISGPVNKLIKSATAKNYPINDLHYFYLIEKNARRLIQLTNQLLDFRKIETGSMKLELVNGNIVDALNTIYLQFKQLTCEKEIHYDFLASEKAITGWYDPDKLEKIVSNLISNAIKFTPEKGRIQVKVEKDPSRVDVILIHVKDNGIGILEKDMDQIFERFSQIENKLTSIHQGAGIGLSLAKDMAELCSGKIRVESSVNYGSEFTVELPVGLTYFNNYVILDESLSSTTNEGIEMSLTEFDESQTPQQEKLIEFPGNVKPTVLIIEDNKDMQFYIADILQPFCKTISAIDGVSGLDMAFDNIPDVIVCDIMMPGKDGFEVTELLKKDTRTSHIPLILLTALDSPESKIEGLDKGANDYITKPFIPDELILKIRNALVYNCRLKVHFKNSINGSVQENENLARGVKLEPVEIVVSGIDEQLVQKAMDVIEKHMDDQEFNVDVFSREMGMEASTLYKKLMALIGLPPGEFIREMRMKRAVQLLKQNKLPISDVGYMVGFESPNYFSKVFRKYYNVSPSEYVKNQIVENEMINIIKSK